MNLETAFRIVEYSSSWGIWAEKINGRFRPESRARFGQKCFENGGMDDDMEFVCSGEWPADMRVDWCDGSEDDFVWDWQFIEHLIESVQD